MGLHFTSALSPSPLHSSKCHRRLALYTGLIDCVGTGLLYFSISPARFISELAVLMVSVFGVSIVLRLVGAIVDILERMKKIREERQLNQQKKKSEESEIYRSETVICLDEGRGGDQPEDIIRALEEA